ncbi:unnamed protein product [Prunus brigantina]
MFVNHTKMFLCLNQLKTIWKTVCLCLYRLGTVCNLHKRHQIHFQLLLLSQKFIRNTRCTLREQYLSMLQRAQVKSTVTDPGSKVTCPQLPYPMFCPLLLP